jgi:FkbM family methyltransferase
LRLWLHVPSDGSWAWLIDRCFEPNQFAFLHSVLRPGMSFIDVGANDGYYSLYASRRVGALGRVLALEPSAREYDRLLDNLRLNGITNVEAVRAAASRDSGTARLRVAEARHAGHNTLGAFIYETALLREEQVPAVPLDALVATKGLTRIDVMKIDVEGAEQAVLEGARGIIGRDHPMILIEVLDKTLRRQGSSQEALLGLLREWGYETYAFDATSGRPIRAAAPIGREENMVAVHPQGLGLPATLRGPVHVA